MAIKIEKQKVIQHIDQDSDHRIEVSYVSSNIGDHVSVMKQFIEKEPFTGQWKNGKGMWIPFDDAEDVAKAILEAVGASEEE